VIHCYAWLRAASAARERGATSVEYALTVGMIAVVIISAVTAVGITVARHFGPATDLFR